MSNWWDLRRRKTNSGRIEIQCKNLCIPKSLFFDKAPWECVRTRKFSFLLFFQLFQSVHPQKFFLINLRKIKFYIFCHTFSEYFVEVIEIFFCLLKQILPKSLTFRKKSMKKIFIQTNSTVKCPYFDTLFSKNSGFL